ncbi:MAG: nuclease-related domain-containing protein [Gammaproteobacteria bacterium]|nr:nuclease-related domain-containing protein [Gammaproteobacteria bacterium]
MPDEKSKAQNVGLSVADDQAETRLVKLEAGQKETTALQAKNEVDKAEIWARLDKTEAILKMDADETARIWDRLDRTEALMEKGASEWVEIRATLDRTEKLLEASAAKQEMDADETSRIWDRLDKTEAILKMDADETARIWDRLDRIEALQDKITADREKNQANLEKSMAKTDAKLKEASEILGGMGNNLGSVVEEYYYNSLKERMILDGIRFDSIFCNFKGFKETGLTEEFDLLLLNGQELFVIEVKHKAHKKDLEKLIKKKGPNFRKLFPGLSNHRQRLALATFHINDDLKNQALSQGVTVLQRKGDVIQTHRPS